MKERTRKVIARDRREAHLKSIILILTLITITCIVFLMLSVRSAEAEKREDAERYKYYTSIVVDPGESLWSIAEEHMTEEYANVYDYVSEIAEINHLKSEYLEAGRELCIPYYSSECKD